MNAFLKYLATAACILAFMSALPKQTLNWVGFLGGQGTLVFTNASNSQPISSVVFELPQDVASAMSIGEITTGWKYRVASDGLSLTDGILEPGQELRLTYHMERYVEPRTVTFPSRGSTTSGQTFNGQGTLTITENLILKYLQMLVEIIPWFIPPLVLVLAVSGLIVPRLKIFGPRIKTDDGEKISTPDIEDERKLHVSIKGCLCLRKQDTEAYVAYGSPPDGYYKWTVSKGSAVIEGADNKQSVQIKGMDIGKAILTVTYQRYGLRTSASNEIEIIYQRFTPPTNFETEIPGMPLVQSFPSVKIETWSEQGQRKVVLAERKLSFTVNVRGKLSDSLTEIKNVEVVFGSFSKNLAKGGPATDFFNDKEFSASIPVSLLGSGFILVKATNTLNNTSVFGLKVKVEIPEKWHNEIVKYQTQLDANRSAGSTPSLRAQEEMLVDKAWDAGLSFAEVSFSAMTQFLQKEPAPQKKDKFSLCVEHERQSGECTIVTSAEPQIVPLKQGPARRLRPTGKARLFILLKKDYDGKLFSFEREGGVRAAIGDDTSLEYFNECCKVGVPVVSVEIQSRASSVHLNANQPLNLEARGYPREINGVAGTYRWKVVACPENAHPAWVPGRKDSDFDTRFIPDVTGLYTFRVYYQVGDIRSIWTYDQVDVMIDIG